MMMSLGSLACLRIVRHLAPRSGGVVALGSQLHRRHACERHHWEFRRLRLPAGRMNNRVAYDWYFVAITLSVLRFDWRLSIHNAARGRGVPRDHLVRRHSLEPAEPRRDAHGTFIPVQFVNRLIMVVGNGAVTVAVAQWARHLRLLIGTDQLTGLLQRRPFFERIDEELQRADFARTQLSVAIFDVDEFKRFNDRLADLEGDRALQRIGEQLKIAVRTTDSVARYGGEEFVIAFPRMDVQLALVARTSLQAASRRSTSVPEAPR